MSTNNPDTKIPNHHQDSISYIRNLMIPETTRTGLSTQAALAPSTAGPEMPWPVQELIIPTYERVGDDYISRNNIRRLLIAELIYLQYYARVITQSGRTPETPAWVPYYLSLKPHDLRKAFMGQGPKAREAGRSIFRQMEQLMRLSPSDRLSTQVMNLLKTTYQQGLMLPAIGQAAFNIEKNFQVDVRFGLAEHFNARELAVWGAFGSYWAKAYREIHGDVAPGKRTEKDEQTRQGYMYLVWALVNRGGYRKKETAEYLGVSRDAVHDWLKA